MSRGIDSDQRPAISPDHCNTDVIGNKISGQSVANQMTLTYNHCCIRSALLSGRMGDRLAASVIQKKKSPKS